MAVAHEPVDVEESVVVPPDGGAISSASSRMRPTVDERRRPVSSTRQGLVGQIDEARQRASLGEIERLEHILAGVDDKLAGIERARRRIATVDLPMPRRKPPTA